MKTEIINDIKRNLIEKGTVVHLVGDPHDFTHTVLENNGDRLMVMPTEFELFISNIECVAIEYIDRIQA